MIFSKKLTTTTRTKIFFFFFAEVGEDTLHCRYAPGIGLVHPISALVFVRISFPYAGYLCVAGALNVLFSERWDLLSPCLIELLQHGLDLGLTSHPNGVESLFSLCDTQGSIPALAERQKTQRCPRWGSNHGPLVL